MKIFFISGIDTDAGKSYVTASLAKFLYDRGEKVTTFKLVQTGSPDGRSVDIDLHHRLSGMPESLADSRKLTYPAVFTYPASPHLAAKIDGRELDFNAIESALCEVKKEFDFILVEGAGGVMVPLTETLLTIDYAAKFDWPLILLTSGKLGSINHTLLSLEAAKHRNMNIKAVIYNLFPQIDELIENGTRDYLQNYLSLNYPGTLYFELPVCNGEKIESTPDYSSLFEVK